MSAKKKSGRSFDWAAVERDWCTGAYTDRELSRKYGPHHTTIARRATGEGWKKDLSKAVQHATNAALIAVAQRQAEGSLTTAEVTARVGKRADAVMAAAELNTQVILRHRTRLAEAEQVVVDLFEELRATTSKKAELAHLFTLMTAEVDGIELASMKQQFGNLMRLHARVGSVQKLADALGKLQDRERIAYGLADGDEKPQELQTLSDEELDREINEHLGGDAGSP